MFDDLKRAQLKADYVLTDRPRHAVDLAKEAADKYETFQVKPNAIGLLC